MGSCDNIFREVNGVNGEEDIVHSFKIFPLID